MPLSPKPLIVALVSTVTFALGAAPAAVAGEAVDYAALTAPQQSDEPAQIAPTQTLSASTDTLDSQTLDVLTSMSEIANTPHGFDVDAAVEAAESEIGTSRPTGWSMPGECLPSARRWLTAGGAAWNGRGNPVANYAGATRLSMKDAQRGDVVQYEYAASPTSWVTGVHTVLITGVNDDGTFTIIQSNSPGGSGLVTKVDRWTPQPPAGFRAVVWRF